MYFEPEHTAWVRIQNLGVRILKRAGFWLLASAPRQTLPDFPHIIWSFTYRGWRLEVDQTEDDGQILYSVWANYDQGCAVAVPCALTREDAIKRGKNYVDNCLNQSLVDLVQ